MSLTGSVVPLGSLDVSGGDDGVGVSDSESADDGVSSFSGGDVSSPAPASGAD
jgi:hypothetical protein